jgi:glyceraldehyde-3-phosphate dehydrogenase (NADP+)
MEYKIYVGGRFKTTTTELKIYSSYNKELIATTYLAGVEELEESISKAQSIQAELANMPSHKRYAVLMQIADSLKIERQHLATILAREAGKPLRYALGEIDRAMQTFIVAAEETKRLPKEYLSLDWTPAGEGKQGLVKFFPIGLVAGIAPFNFPLNLAVHKIAPAIAAGNPII